VCKITLANVNEDFSYNENRNNSFT